jgi:hypothetical protein
MKANILSEILAYYDRFPEESRLESGPSLLEFERTKDILSRVLPGPPARIVDVGGAAGAYSCGLPSAVMKSISSMRRLRLVGEARRRSEGSAAPIQSLSVADARRLPQESGFAEVVLVMGPLYHLPSEPDRVAALGEAFRVLSRGGIAPRYLVTLRRWTVWCENSRSIRTS